MSDKESTTEAIEMEVLQPSALEAMERAVTATLVDTAKRYPRSVAVCKKKALELACLDPDTAAECFYKYTRGGKVIEGPSIRLAEIVASTWQNIRAGSRTISEGETTITAQAFCHDLENNVFIARETERRITNKEGVRYNDDMITLTKNAACSIALRNSVFSVIPKAIVKSIYDSAKQVAVGDLKTLAERRGKAVDYFTKMGVDSARIFQALGVKGMDDIGLEQLETLTGLRTAVNEKETTLDEAFPALIKAPKLVNPEPDKSSGRKERQQQEARSREVASADGAAVAGSRPDPEKKDDLLEA